MHAFIALGVAVVVGTSLAPELPGALPCAVVALLGVCLSKWRRWALLPTGLALGGLVGSSVPAGPVLRGHAAVIGTVAAAPMGRVGDLAVQACASGGGFRPCAGRVRVIFDAPPAPGSRWVVAGSASAPRSPRILGAPDPSRSARLAGVRTILRARSSRLLEGELPPTAPPTGPAGVLAAVATGDRRGVDPAAWDVLRDTGTAHLLAISGFHVGVVAGGVGGLVAVGMRLLAVFRPGGMSPAVAWWAGAGAAVLYTGLAGAPISAQRAAGVACLAALGRSFGRSLDPLRLLGLVAAAVCMVDPSAPSSPGFQLSFGAVVGLVRFGPALDRAIPKLPGLGWAARGLVATGAATLGTLPAAAWWFQSLSVTSPLANLIAIPWMAVGVVPWAMGASWLPEPLASGASAIGTRSVSGLLWVLGWLRAPPLAPAVGPLGALGLCAIFARVRLGWVVSVLLLGLGLRSRSAGALEVTFFDVGQGDSALVEAADGTRWLIDGGRGEGVLRALRRRGVRHLDRVVASHADADHTEGLLPVLQQLSVGELWIGRWQGHDELVDIARLRGVEIRVQPSAVQGSDNDASLVVRARSPWGDVLFAGDIEQAGEAVLRGPAAVLKVPHHGSKTSSSEAFLDQVRPSLAVLSVGPNRYGHPHRAVLGRYQRRGIPVARTDLDGTLVVRLEASGISVYSEATGPLMVLAGERLANQPNTTTANTASRIENPWLYDSVLPSTLSRK